MNRLIDDMLDFARARLAGGIPLTRAPADFGALVQRAAQEYQTAFPARRIEIQCQGDLTGHWDADRLAQVVIEHYRQCAAARRRGRAGAGAARWHVADSVTCEVINAGAIDPGRAAARLRTISRRPAASRAATTASGLGLYIAQQIVHAHEGRIRVDPDNRTHTVFSVTVPRRQPDA